MTLDTVLDDLARRIAERLQQPTQATSGHRLLTIRDAANYLGRTTRSVHRLISNHHLRAVRADRRLYLDKHDLDQFINDHKH